MAKSIEEILAQNRLTGRGYDESGQARAFTDEEFFDVSCEMGWNQNNQEYRRLFEFLADWVMKNLRIRTAIEIGAGPGYFLYCLNRRGIECTGVDGNPYSKAFFDSLHGDISDKYVIDKFLENTYTPVDALFSIEVFEHIPDEGIANIMSKITNELKPKIIMFSSTPYADPNPGWDLQWGHINLKSSSEWHELFASYDYHLHQAKPPVTEWAALYTHSSIMG